MSLCFLCSTANAVLCFCFCFLIPVNLIFLWTKQLQHNTLIHTSVYCNERQLFETQALTCSQLTAEKWQFNFQFRLNSGKHGVRLICACRTDLVNRTRFCSCKDGVWQQENVIRPVLLEWTFRFKPGGSVISLSDRYSRCRYRSLCSAPPCWKKRGQSGCPKRWKLE